MTDATNNTGRPSGPADLARDLYLDLMKRSLTSSIYPGTDGQPWPASSIWRRLIRALVPSDVRFFRLISREQREGGRYWPAQAHTMIGNQRLDNLKHCVETCIREGEIGRAHV